MLNRFFRNVGLKFQHRGLILLARSCCVALLWTSLVPGQTLNVKVIDPFSDAVVNAIVAVGDTEVPTDDSGVAVFSGLGDGPHSLVVIAPDFATAIQEVAESDGSVTIKLQLQAVSEVIDVQAKVGTRSDGVQPLESLFRSNWFWASGCGARGSWRQGGPCRCKHPPSISPVRRSVMERMHSAPRPCEA